MSQEHRDKIKNSNILSALIACAEGTKELTPTQVTAGLGLLKKALPDLSTVTLQGDEEGGPISTVTRIELVAPSLNDDSADTASS